MLICLYTTGVGLNPIYYHAIEKFEMKESLPSGTRAYDIPLDELIVKAEIKITEILAWGAQILIPLWKNLFLVSSFLLFLITLLSYLPDFIKRESKASFLIISIFTIFTVIFIGCSTTKHYLLYSFPFYFVMLSHLAVKSFERIKKEKSHKNIFRVFIIVLTVIILFSYFVTGVTSPYWDEGEFSWANRAVDYIKSDIAKSGYEGNIIIGMITLGASVEYSIHLNDLNATPIFIMTPASEHSSELANVDIEMINKLKPHYLIVDEMYYFYLEGKAGNEIFKDYALVFHSQTYPYRCFVFKRKNMQPPELLSPMDGKDGKISQDIFKSSISSVMKVGKAYTALVQVKNTGDSRTNFTVIVQSKTPLTIFVNEKRRSMTLDKGSTRMLKFKIVPVKEYVGEFPITVDLYAKYDENGTRGRVDSFSDYVYLIKR
jgi:hypothetical protein